LREFLTQFNLIAPINAWPDSMKTVALASSLRGKARAVLDGIFEIENLKFEEFELRSRLKLHYGKGHLTQMYYTQFTNRRQKSAEDLASLGLDIERLSRLAYPECTKEIRDKIACTQFIVALSDGFIKRTLQLGVVSLRLALERATLWQLKQYREIVLLKEMKKEMIFVKWEGKINSIIGITEIFSMLKKVKIKLEGNLMDFKRGNSFCPKRSAGSVANKDISGQNVLL